MLRSRFVIAALVGVLFGTSGGRAAEPAAAKILTAEAKGFLHVRVGEVWTADVAAQLRAFVAQAGPGTVADFDSGFYPSPSEVESFTVVLFDTNFRHVLPAGRPVDATPVWVVTSKKPLDRAELLKTMAKTGKPRKHAGKDYFFDEAQWSGLLILDEHSYAYASEDSIIALIDRMSKPASTPLAALLTREAAKHPVTLGVNVPLLATPEFVKAAPPELAPLFQAKTLLVALDLKTKTTLSVALEFGTAAEAGAGLKGAQEAVQLGRGLIGQGLTFVEQRAKRDPAKGPAGVAQFPETVGFLLAAAGLKQLDALVGAMLLEQKGSSVHAALELDRVLPGGSTAVSIAAVAVAIGVAVSDADRNTLSPGNYEWTDRERNLAAVAKAIEKYHKDKGHYPPPAILDKDGKPLLSWRVAILPYMDYAWINSDGPAEKPINGPNDLYKLFKLDEPWNGPNNKKLITRLPSVYRAPWSVLPYSQSASGKTTTLAVVGKGGLFDPAKKTVAESDVRDGLKHTLLLLQLEEAGHAVYWTKPADVALTAEGKLPADAPNLNRRFAVVYADGSAHTLINGLDAKTFLGIFTRDGNEELEEKAIRPEPIKGKGNSFGEVPPAPLAK